ncbi:MAG: right-handed parallel beta-helix repeat-containing protein [Deltaproteobacteria bacterium]|nr:right-handed parallel beta-helix repeat-containing protein [Deltaproteobacteria bacterium]
MKTGMIFTCAILALLCLYPAGAQAATYTVDRTDDSALATACTEGSNDCSLRGAIIKANGDAAEDTIILPAGTYVLTRAGAFEDVADTGDLDILEDVRIEGEGACRTVIDGNGLDRVFDVGRYVSCDGGDKTAHLELSGLKVTGGAPPTSSAWGGEDHPGNCSDDGQWTADGGGILVRRGPSSTGSSLTLEAVQVDSNLSRRDGGGIMAESYTTLSLTGSTISRNESHTDGGGISMLRYADMTMVNCTVSGNRITGWGYGGGVHFLSSGGDVMITSSTITDNTNDGDRHGDGAGLGGRSRDIYITHTVIAGNHGRTDAPAPYNPSTDSTSDGPNDWEKATRPPETFLTDLSHDVGEVDLFSHGYNFIGIMYEDGVDFDDQATDQFALVREYGTEDSDIATLPDPLDPMLGELKDWGGCIETHMPLSGSPLINSGSPDCEDSEGNPLPGSDQRGAKRKSPCDIGSVEEGVRIIKPPIPTLSTAGILAVVAALGVFGLIRIRKSRSRKDRS